MNKRCLARLPKLSLTVKLMFYSLVFANLLIAQESTFIKLVDRETNNPIQGAFFAYDTLQFGVSDHQGEFSLDLQKEALPLRISHLSYQDTLLLIDPATPKSLILSLRPVSVVLPEISVSDRPKRKFRNPAHLLKMALRAVPENYVTTQTYPVGHYQEIITHQDCPISVAEGIFEYRFSPYGEKHSHKKAWKEGWNRRYASYERPFIGGTNLGFDHAEGTQYYPAVSDAYRPVQTRYSQLAPSLEVYNVFTDGPLDMLALDKLRLGYDFLSVKKLKDYDFQLLDSTFVNGVYCYHLSFEPDNEAPTQYSSLDKTPKAAAFSGHLYISIQTLAIVRYEAWNSKVVVRNFSHKQTRRAPVESIRIRVDYSINQAEKWQLSNVESRVASPIDPSFVAIRLLQLDRDNTPQNIDTQKVWYGFNFLNHLHNLTYKVDSTFWVDFKHSSLAKASAQHFDESCTNDLNFTQSLASKTISVPKVNPKGNLDYVKPGQQKRTDWQWLEATADSATMAYLRWENDYYAQFFLNNRTTLDAVAAQFSSEHQGVSDMAMPIHYPDTIFKNTEKGLGFYRINGEEDERLIVAVDQPLKGYVITKIGWEQTGRYFHVLATNRAYDGALAVHSLTNEVAMLNKVDDCQWSGDTLYALTNNDQLRTHAFFRWTANDGWTEIMKEANTDFEFRLHTLTNGELILIKESLTTAFVLRQKNGHWLPEENSVPAMLVGSGPKGLSCQIDIDADYVIDCRNIGNQECVIIAKGGRQHLYVRHSPEERWAKIEFPLATSLANFIDLEPDAITINLEGVGSYGRQAIVDVANKKLKLLPQSSASIELTGYANTVVWVKSADGVSIPCQMRWRIDQQDSLKNTLLKVYGAYGNPYFVGHSETDIAMMNLGFVVVYVHTRGGGMLGPDWYDNGRAEYKIQACTDYVAALRFFKNNHPLGTTPLSGYAQSAGGPILGYAVNQYPNLLQSAVFDHAFLDVLGVMQRPELPLTQYEYLEWGDPTKKEFRKLQSQYSPFQNIKSQPYPAMFFMGGLHDKSTPYWQVAKFVAALRWANEDTRDIIFHTNLNGSHPGTPFGPTQAQLYEQISFLLRTSTSSKD